MNRCCNCNCCNCLCWFCFLPRNWEHWRQHWMTGNPISSWRHWHWKLLQAELTLSSLATTIHCTADNQMQTARCRQPEADSWRQTAGGRQPEADNQMQTARCRQPKTVSQRRQPAEEYSQRHREPADMGLTQLLRQPAHNTTQCGHLCH
jgi:hypothetical protein